MRAIKPNPPRLFHQSAAYDAKGYRARRSGVTYVNPNKDRTLAGKARRLARKHARRLVRTPFFKGHGIASSNAFNLRYDCTCGHSIIAPRDDYDFMVDVMAHEGSHTAGALANQ
jgi:hypothetical protein